MKLIFIVTAIVFCLTARADNSQNSEKHVSEKLFSRLDVCALKDFTLSEGVMHSIRNMFVYSDMRLANVEQLIEIFTWNSKVLSRIPDLPKINRYQSQQTFSQLAEIMREDSVRQIDLLQFRSLAEQEILKAKEDNKIGECYTIQIRDLPLRASIRHIALDVETQRQIDRLFILPLIRQSRLSARENNAYRTGTLNKREIRELRAIRKATELFEQNTELRHDNAGGYISNLHAHLFGDFQLTSEDEAVTFRNFLKTLQARGIMKYFNVENQLVEMQPPFERNWLKLKHKAVALRNKRTGMVYVLDSWYESGGQAAHILTYDDWLQQPIMWLGAHDFPDVVRLIQ